MAGPSRRKSDDFANALEEAVSAMHEDDLQLMGSTHELTIDQIHSLSSEGGPCGQPPGPAVWAGRALNSDMLPARTCCSHAEPRPQLPLL